MTNYVWSNAVTGTWSSRNNWTPNGVPGSAGGDTAFIGAIGSNYVVTFDEPTETINQLTISSSNATLTFAAGETLTVNSDTQLSAGTINLNATGVTVNFGGLTTPLGTTINIGNNATDTMSSASLGGLVNMVGTATFGASNTGITLTGGTIEATGGTGTVNFSSLNGLGTFEANGAKLIVAGSLSRSLATNIITNSASSVFVTTGNLNPNDSLTASFLGPNGEFEYNNPGHDSRITFNLSGLNAGVSGTTPTNFFDFGNETVTISSGGTGFGTLGSIVMSNGDTLSLTGITGSIPLGWRAITKSDGAGGTEVFLQSVCYAAGTRIMTATGERPVESLLSGDLVATLSGNDIAQRPIRWIGRRRIDLAAHPRPHTVAPIRILRHALADGVPHTDLLVSPDHGILIGGKLICARQLVNGATIRQETGWKSVTYYHVELDAHAILLAEGAPAESYLDTGNRDFFSNAGVPIRLHPDLTEETGQRAREASSCVSFAWDEDTVRPIWEGLAERARAQGLTLPVAAETDDDPAMCVIARGRETRAISHEDGRYVFVLPRGTSAVRLRSRAALPTDARPWLEDRRLLGVYLTRIVLRWDDEVREIPLDHPSLTQGWWAVERSGDGLQRWTDGDALLPLPAVDAPVVLELRTSAMGLAYPINERLAA
jgi:hypothetical protein